LFGEVNPSAKLPVSFPRSIGQLPDFYNYLQSDRGYYHKPGSYDKPGRDYVFDSTTALFPFGFGQSYTTFSVKDIKSDKDIFSEKGTITVSATVSNTGDRDGAEVLQLYVHRDYAQVVTPVKELKAFKKVFLKKGETKNVNLEIPVGDLVFYNNEGNTTSLKGEYDLMIGNSSENIISQKKIKVL
jgi:beta-glucosidase